MTDKRTSPGRPRVHDDEKTQPYTVSLTPSEVDAIRKLGDGNLTAGIRKAIENMTTQNKPNYFADPITTLALDIYHAAYKPHGEADPDTVGEIEDWLRQGDLDNRPNVAELAAEWLEL